MTRRGIPGRRTARGFTLVEMLAVLAILGVIAGVGMPMLTTFMQSGQVRTTALDLVADLQFARGEAIKRNASVAVLPVTDGSWAAGWRVHAGADTSAPVLRERLRSAGMVAITSASTSFVFAANGRLDGMGGMANVQFCPTQTGSSTGRLVEIQLSGLARSSTKGCTA